jgi:hypothetical protein
VPEINGQGVNEQVEGVHAVANRPRFGCYSQVRILQLCRTQLKDLS